MIRQAKNEDEAVWDRFVLSRTDAAPYHLFAWKKAIESAYGHKCYYLLAEDDKEVVGVLPIVHLKLPLVLSKLVALPYCDVGGILCQNEDVQDRLLEFALQLMEQVKARDLELRGNLFSSEARDLHFQEAYSGKVRMLLNLPSSSEKLLAAFKAKLRSQIRKAEKNEVSFRWGGRDELDILYDIFCRNMHLLGSPVHAKSLFNNIFKQYTKNVRIGLVEYSGKTIGMGILLTCNRIVSIPWASTLRDYNRLAPNMLLYWNLLKFAADSGYTTFDFGRSTAGEGTYRFKKQWGAEAHPLQWWHSGLPAESSAGGKKRELAAQVWRKLPLPVANSLGPVLRKYISL